MTFRQIVTKLNQGSTPLLPKNKFLRFSLIAVFILSLSLISKNIFALEASNPYLDKSNAIKTGNNQEAWLNEGLVSNAVSVFNGMTGGVPASFFDAAKKNTSQIYIPGGAMGNMNTMIAALYTPPASGIEYIAQIKDNLLGKPAYAQGIGFQGLQFLLPLWRSFRNVVYVLCSLVFVVIGIMIMLRVKISPQAVITVQSAVPQLITTLILVTFSYAIAGLVIDICNFLQAFIVAILFSAKGIPLSERLFSGFFWGTGLPIISDIGNAVTWFKDLILGASNSSFGFNHLSNPDLHDMQMLTYRAVPGWLSLVMLGGLLGSIILGFFLGGIGNMVYGTEGATIFDITGRVIGGAAGGLLGGLIIPIILCIIVAIWLIKLYFGLIKNYVTLIFKIIMAPLEIGAGAFPNSKIGFSTWILDVVANMAVFPIVGIFLVILNMLIDAIAGADSIIGFSGASGGIDNSAIWAPSLISANGINPSIVAACVGLAGLALLSKLPEMVPQFIFMIKPSPFGQAIGQGLEGAVKDVQKSAPYQAGETYIKGKTYNKVGKTLAGYPGTGKFATAVQQFGNQLQDGTSNDQISETIGKKIM